jgi:predicted TPR repeat methyltransferase
MAAPNHQTQSMKQQALDLLQRNQLPQAKALYRQICETRQSDWESWHMLSAVHGMLGELAESEACSRKVIALQPTFAGAHVNLGNALMAQGKHDQAAASYRRALELAPNDPQTHNNLGNLLKAQGRLSDAEACYRKALACAPNYPDAHSNLGLVLQDQGRLDEALAHYQRAIQLKADHADAFYNLGYGLLAKGQLDAAATCFQQLVQVRPDDAKGWSMLGATLGQVAKYEQAISSCQRAIALQPDYAEAYCNLGNIYKSVGQAEKAESMYREALRHKPDFASARYFLAALGAESAPDSSPSDYVRELFDGYAEKFDQHLVQELEYKTPELLNQFVRNALATTEPADVLDLGCGTGLGGVVFRDIARRLVGVDLSPKMIGKAKQRKIYDELMVGDVLAPLAAPDAAFDLIIATDVFVYIGDLSRIFAAAKTALRPGGLFAFSTEAEDGSGTFVLRTSGRYAHTEAYIRYLSGEAGLAEISMNRVILRKEAGKAIEGNIFVLRQP